MRLQTLIRLGVAILCLVMNGCGGSHSGTQVPPPSSVGISEDAIRDSIQEVVSTAPVQSPGLPSDSADSLASGISTKLQGTSTTQEALYLHAYDYLKSRKVSDYYSALISANASIDTFGQPLKLADGSEVRNDIVDPLAKVPSVQPQDSIESTAKQEIIESIGQIRDMLPSSNAQVRTRSIPWGGADSAVRANASTIKDSIRELFSSASGDSDTSRMFYAFLQRSIGDVSVRNRNYRPYLEELVGSIVYDEVQNDYKWEDRIEDSIAKLRLPQLHDATLGIAQVRISTAREIGVTGSSIDIAYRLASDNNFCISLVPKVVANKYKDCGTIRGAVSRYHGSSAEDGRTSEIFNRLPYVRSLIGSTNAGYVVWRGRHDGTYFPNVIINDFNFVGIPFGMWDYMLRVRHNTSVAEHIDRASESIRGQSGCILHVIQHSSWADNVHDGVAVGLIRVVYSDGDSSSQELLTGVNTAEWSYDKPSLHGYMQHTKIPHARSEHVSIDGESFDGHYFYTGIPLKMKPIEAVELGLRPDGYTNQRYYGRSYADWYAIRIDAITLEKP